MLLRCWQYLTIQLGFHEKYSLSDYKGIASAYKIFDSILSPSRTQSLSLFSLYIAQAQDRANTVSNPQPFKTLPPPITTNLPTPISNCLTFLFGAPYHDALLRDPEIFTYPECLTVAISKALGIAIITTAAVIRVPQILKPLQSQSAAGPSFTSYVLETASFIITLEYNIRGG
jgi:PQ loop repeat